MFSSSLKVFNIKQKKLNTYKLIKKLEVIMQNGPTHNFIKKNVKWVGILSSLTHVGLR